MLQIFSISIGERGDKMRIDCINECIGDNIKKITHNCLYPFYVRYILWRNESAYLSYQDLKLCEDNVNFYREIKNGRDKIVNERVKMRNECEMKCRSDCVNRYYKKLTTLIDELPSYDVLPLNTAKIQIYHNNMPDQLTEHMEGMTFIDFFGSFGGLVGVWLGFSIATVLSDVLIIIRDKYHKLFNLFDIMANTNKSALIRSHFRKAKERSNHLCASRHYNFSHNFQYNR